MTYPLSTTNAIFKMKHLAFMIAATGLISSALAGPNRCEIDGKTVYQDHACPGGGGRQIDTRHGGQYDPTSRGAIIGELHIAEYQRSMRMREAIEQRRVIFGMRPAEVVRAWGNPNNINSTSVPGRSTEQWVYRHEEGIRANYVYFTNGVVTSIQMSQ